MRVYRVDEKPLSVNHAYQTFQAKNKNPQGKQGWKNKVWRKLTDEAASYQYLIRETLGLSDMTRNGGQKISFPDPSKGQGMALSLVFYFPANRLRRKDKQAYLKFDVSNCVKLVEDAVFEYLGIDDSVNLEVFPSKRESWDLDWHFVIVLSHTSIYAPVSIGGRLVDPGVLYGSAA